MTTTSLFLLKLVVIVGLCCSVSAQNQCTALSGREGQCILIQYCPSLYAISRKTSLTANDRSILLNSQCGSEGTAPKMCCEDLVRPMVSENVTAGGGCTTPNNINGRCIELKTCDSLYSLLTNPPLSAENRQLLRQSQCGVIGRQPLVCCPRTVATTTTTELPVPVFNTGSGLTPRSNLLPDLADCGTGLELDKILGGEKTSLKEFPWMALLQYERDNSARFSCGGALISKRYVLTAAHCVKGAVVRQVGDLKRVRLGEFDLNNAKDCTDQDGCNSPEDIEIEEIIPHAGWVEKNPSQHNDIALLRLNRDVTFTAFIKPICLPNKGRDILLVDEQSAEESLWVAGWGLTERGVSSNLKLKLKIPLKPLSQCQGEYQRVSKNKDINLKEKTQFCAGGQPNKDTCKGDSGGPAMSLYVDSARGEAVWFSKGIVSFGPFPCGQPGIPGVYTKTNQFIDWILSNMRP